MAKYDAFSREELIKLLQRQDKLLASKKYGIVWDGEKEPEQVVVDCAQKLPILKSVKEKDIKTTDDDYNIMIEGDNYHALQVLNYTHKGKIDVIYIDPPYNTGNKDFVYNDKFVDKEDGYRHSKWLNFMEKRLELARELLTENGVIFISIDDNEQANLRLLCDKIFGENNFIACICRQAIKGGSRALNIKTVHDYVLIYAKDPIKLTPFTGFKKEDILLNLQDEKGFFAKGRELNKWGAGSRREDSPSMWFPIKGPNNEDVYPIRNDGSDGRWRWGKKKLLAAVEAGDVIFEKRENGTYVVYEKVRGNKTDTTQFTSWFADAYINAKGSETLKEIFQTSMSIFDYAKPTELISHLIFMSNHKNGIVLDFFAGSGTTAHSVLNLNKQDGGKRKFIVCTNNDNNIATTICYPRIQKIIHGYNKNNNTEFVEGLGGNLKYFKTDFVDNSKNSTQTKVNLAKKCAEMLCLKTGRFNELQCDNRSFKIFSNNANNQYTCIYFDCFDTDMHDFVSEIKKLHGQKELYIFSLTDTVDSSLFEGIADIKVEAIPYKILDLYKRIAKAHIKGIDND